MRLNSMNVDIFKKNHFCIAHPDGRTECHRLIGNAAFMDFTETGKTRISIEAKTDWIDFEDSTLIGGSEAFVKIWGINATDTDLENGLKKTLTQKVRDMPPLGDDIFAWVFASIGHRVDNVSIAFLGKRRIRAKLMIEDISTKTRKANTM